MVGNFDTLLNCQDLKRFEKWKREVHNFLFYVDSRKENPKLEVELFKKGFDSIEAGEMILKA